ncbi:BACON domain-containing protein [Tahibacter soli]|uniref:BACON domain-containing protein n=1 Tax=Tahibacter soli TaxID=2983605 RepID=A0A9X3YHP9_9GAMM|nr:hypothetical protein [Tahibacter soli]MDC8011206.1 hypothetical protein [Tahibacter soli]
MAVFRLPGIAVALAALSGAAQAAAQLDLAVTVGTDLTPGFCATTTTLGVLAGSDVNYCYRATNTGTSTLQYHDLIDSAFGVVLDDEPIALAPGASTTVTRVRAVAATTTSNALWTARTRPYQLRTSGQQGGPTYDFIDISTPGAGTALNLSDDGEVNLTLPFAFTFDGATSNALRVGNNGAILFGTTTGDVGVDNAVLPAASLGRAMAPFWDDLDDETGDVYYVVQGAAPNRRAIVQWQARAHFVNPQSPTPDTATFEVVLFESGNIVLFQYKDVDFGNAAWNAGASATVGLNLSGGLASMFSFSQPSLASSFAIRFTPSAETASDSAAATVLALRPGLRLGATSFEFGQAPDTTRTVTLAIGNDGDFPLSWSIAEAPAACAAAGDVAWLSVAPNTGSVPAGESVPVDVIVDTAGLADGDYTAVLCLTTNDPDAASTALPLTVHVADTIFADGFEL